MLIFILIGKIAWIIQLKYLHVTEYNNFIQFHDLVKGQVEEDKNYTSNNNSLDDVCVGSIWKGMCVESYKLK